MAETNEPCEQTQSVIDATHKFDPTDPLGTMKDDLLTNTWYADSGIEGYRGLPGQVAFWRERIDTSLLATYDAWVEANVVPHYPGIARPKKGNA
jgi:hypothetical protein